MRNNRPQLLLNTPIKMLNLKRLAIHEVEKERNVSEAHPTYSTNLTPITENAVKLLERLDERYTSLRNTHAIFGDESGARFPTLYNTYHNALSDEGFLEFSTQAVQALCPELRAASAAKGGYIVFAEYERNHSFIGVFLIRNTTGLFLKKQDEDTHFQINDFQHVDIERLAMACRINHTYFSTYTSAKKRYISFINRRNDDSNFFLRWISSANEENDTTDTNHLYDILKCIPIPETGTDGLPLSREKFLENAYHAVRVAGYKVDLLGLSTTLFGDETKIKSFVVEKDIPMNDEFRANQSGMKKFIKLRAQADDIDITFPPEYFNNNKIKIDENNPELIIINSRALAEAIEQKYHGNQ